MNKKETKVIHGGSLIAVYPDFMTQVQLGQEFYVGQMRFYVDSINPESETVQRIYVTKNRKETSDE